MENYTICNCKNVTYFDVAEALHNSPTFSDVEKKEYGSFSITIETKHPAFYVVVESGNVDGRFSDNFFTLLPGENKTITFKPKHETDEEKFKEELTVMDISRI